jgi:hypothetical protein
VNFRLGYRFPNGLWRGHAKGLHVQAGLGNLGGRQTPFANSVYGYNQALYSPSVAPTISRSHCRFKVEWGEAKPLTHDSPDHRNEETGSCPNVSAPRCMKLVMRLFGEFL